MFQRISVEEAKQVIEQQAVTIFDVRDEIAYKSEHIAGAHHLGRENLQEIYTGLPKDQKILIYCYHGNTSQMIAQMLINFGFSQILSMDGGFEAWRQKYPNEDLKAEA